MRTAYEHRRAQLSNGLTVVTVELPHLHSTTISVYARVGSRHESKESNGLSHFFEHMIFRGCSQFPDSTSLNAAMEDLGGTLDGCTQRDLSTFQTCVHPSGVAEALRILGLMFQTPSFRDIDLERSIILEEMLDSLDERGRILDLDAISHHEAFKAHPLSQPIDGTRRNVRRFTVDDLKKHRRRFYGADNLVLCVAGKLDHSQVLEIAEEHFGQLFRGKKSKESAPKLPIDAPRFKYVHAHDPKTRIRLSYRTVAQDHEDYPALLLLRKILDAGLSSRLQVEMVEHRGLVYEIGANVESYSDCGLFDFELSVAHKKLGLALASLAEIIQDVRTRADNGDCVERVRKRTRLLLSLGLDSAFEFSDWFGPSAWHGALVTPEQRVTQLERVEPDQVRRVADKYFRPERLTVAAVGGADRPVINSARKAVQTSLGEA